MPLNPGLPPATSPDEPPTNPDAGWQSVEIPTSPDAGSLRLPTLHDLRLATIPGFDEVCAAIATVGPSYIDDNTAEVQTVVDGIVELLQRASRAEQECIEIENRHAGLSGSAVVSQEEVTILEQNLAELQKQTKPPLNNFLFNLKNYYQIYKKRCDPNYEIEKPNMILGGLQWMIFDADGTVKDGSYIDTRYDAYFENFTDTTDKLCSSESENRMGSDMLPDYVRAYLFIRSQPSDNPNFNQTDPAT